MLQTTFKRITYWPVYFILMLVTAGATGCNLLGNAGECTLDVPDSVHPNGSRASAVIFYPCDLPDNDEIYDATTVTGGATNTKENMYWLAEYLRDEGDLIVIAVSARNNFSISSYEAAHKAGVGILKELNRSSPSLGLNGRLGNIAVMGYSMGGAGALQAAHDLGSNIDAAIGLAPWNTSSNLSGITVPSAVLVGSRDSTASPRMVQSTFNNLPSFVPKAYGEIYGEGHLYWVNNSGGQPAEEYILAWLKYYLSADISYVQTLRQPPVGVTNYEYRP